MVSAPAENGRDIRHSHYHKERTAVNLPQYVTIEEVQRICRELGLQDWTALKEAKVTLEEAAIILETLAVKDLAIVLEDFRQGLEVELEHGLTFDDANVTNNHPVLTGKIVLAHFRESLDYYQRLEVAEIEGDLFKAAAAGDTAKLERYYKKLVKAKLALSQHEAKGLV
jgi:predicted acyltransferase (DUF342 family)